MVLSLSVSVKGCRSSDFLWCLYFGTTQPLSVHTQGMRGTCQVLHRMGKSARALGSLLRGVRLREMLIFI